MEVQTLLHSEIRAIRDEVKDVQKANKLTNSRIAKEAGVASSTYSQFLSETYMGNNDGPAKKLQNWLVNFKENEATLRKIGRTGEYIQTREGKRVWSVLRYCLAGSKMAAIMANPGLGKTRTASAFATKNARCYLVTISPTCAKVNPMLAELCRIMERETANSARRMRRVVDIALEGPASLLVFDEAQHLTIDALEELRAIHDATGCGLLLMGNKRVVTRIEGPSRLALFAQLRSRMGMKLTLDDVPPVEDVKLVANSLANLGESQMEFLIKISRKPGALRNVAETISLARQVSYTNLQAPISLDQLQAAHSQLS